MERLSSVSFVKLLRKTSSFACGVLVNDDVLPPDSGKLPIAKTPESRPIPQAAI